MSGCSLATNWSQLESHGDMLFTDITKLDSHYDSRHANVKHTLTLLAQIESFVFLIAMISLLA